ncbi:MAG: hypothetical protein IJC52_02930 [Clostridia bacterium]|nr:hypothetical protein [Clostridia bacterium]
MKLQAMRGKMTPIVVMHYVKLVLRSLLFLSATTLYVIDRFTENDTLFLGLEHQRWLLLILWVWLLAEMVLRFFPSKWESMGCQKQFRATYREAKTPLPTPPQKQKAWPVALAWCALNAVFGVLYVTGIFDKGIMILISAAYAVCDVVCILFFCPFQTWFLKNKCCVTCRIYNWDYAMMFTPLMFVPHPLTWSLLLVALVLLVQWEIAVKRHPERFCEDDNRSLRCPGCREKLCHHKRQLQGLLKEGNYHLTGNVWFSSLKNKRRNR